MIHAFAILFLTVLGDPGALPADTRWILPAHGGVLFDRTLEIEVLTPPPGIPDPEAWRPGFVESHPPPLLLDGELDPDRRRIAEPLRGLRDLARQTAFDLSVSLRREERRVHVLDGDYTIRPLRARLVYEPVDGLGRQRIHGKLTPTRPERPIDHDDTLGATVEGELSMVRTVSIGSGKISWFECAMTLDWTPDDSRVEGPARVELKETWSLLETIDPASAAHRWRIIRSLARGREHLEESVLERALTDAEYMKSVRKDLGFVLAALLRVGARPAEPVIRRGFDRLREEVPDGVYDLSGGLLALGALHDAVETVGTLAPLWDGYDLALAETWARRLEEALDRAVASKSGLVFSDEAFRAPVDLDAYVVALGLDAAARCGVTIEPSTWRAMAEHWIALARIPDSGTVAYTLRHEDGSERRIKARPAAWGPYDHIPAQGVYTAEALHVLTLCGHRLAPPGGRSRKGLPPIDRTRLEGMAWLAERFTVRANPGLYKRWNSDRIEYLHALVRYLGAAGIRALEGRDGRTEAALVLMAWQYKSGGFGRNPETCLALMALAEALDGG